MKIAIFTDSFYPSINGVVTSTLSFVRELSKLGHEIQIYCPYLKGVKNLSIDNVQIIPLKGIPALFYPDFKFTTFSTPKVLNKIRKFNPDIIHFHTQFVIGFKGIIIGKIFKKPVVGTYHTNIADEGYLKNIKMDNVEFIKKYAHKYNNFYYDHADIVLSPSNDSKLDLIKSGIDEKKIKILYNPLPKEDKIDEVKFLDGIDGDIVLYVGRIAEEKNIDKGIEIMSNIIKSNNKIKFVLVGDGPSRKKIERYVKSKGFENNIFLLGMIDHKTLINSDIFKKSKIFFTSSLSETFGITIIEALSFGLPVIGFAKGGLNDLIINNYNGFLFETNDIKGISNGIVNLIEKRDLYKDNCIKYVEKFDAVNLTKELVNIYELAIQEKINKNH